MDEKLPDEAVLRLWRSAKNAGDFIGVRLAEDEMKRRGLVIPIDGELSVPIRPLWIEAIDYAKWMRDTGFAGPSNWEKLISMMERA